MFFLLAPETDASLTQHVPDPALENGSILFKTIMKCEDIISEDNNQFDEKISGEEKNKIVPDVIKKNRRRGRPPKITANNAETIVDEIDINEKLTDLDEKQIILNPPKKKRGRQKSSHSLEDTKEFDINTPMICSVCDLELSRKNLFNLHIGKRIMP